MRQPHDGQSHLFSDPLSERHTLVPLAERLRPQTLEEFFGQEALVGPTRPLRRAIETDTVSSIILWGPPGSGKTTLARIIARQTNAAFVHFSAVTNGIPELRKVVQAAQHHRRLQGRRTILFVDEIHRFNKAQQDAFLPYVEDGTIILLGATTENPSFEVISPLLSRSLVAELHPLSEEALGHIVDRACGDAERGYGKRDIHMTQEARQHFIRVGNGDARALLTMFEFAVDHAPQDPNGRVVLDRAALEQVWMTPLVRYDSAGEEHYNVISAYIKSLRDSDPDGGLYWLARMLEGGEDPKFIARRMIIFASEDIGNADPMALVVATAVFQAVDCVGLPEARINLAQGTTFLASCLKDNASYAGLREASDDARQLGNLAVPLHLRNAVTPLMKQFGYGKNYKYVHKDPSASSTQTHLPEPLVGKHYYRPKPL